MLNDNKFPQFDGKPILLYLAVVDKPIPRTITLLNSNLASYNQDDPSNMGYAWSMDGQVLRN